MAKNIKRLELNKPGSALIMTVVLTVMLSIVAVMFVAVARMDMASTGNIADNKALESSTKSIIELINRQLVLDTPGVAGQEYYDYPDANNAWLASIEPYIYNDSCSPADTNRGVYRWRQISDVTGGGSFGTQDVDVRPSSSQVIKDYPVLTPGGLADADGDGIADSKWFELPNMRSSKGKPIYAAVRVIDNSGMVNINTAYLFDPTSAGANKIDGNSLLQINLKGLLKGTSTTEIDNQFNALHTARCGAEPSNNWAAYNQNVIWRYGEPNGNYLPFDISDELELRYRCCIDSKFLCRLERKGASPIIPDTMKGYGIVNSGYLYNGDDHWGLFEWQIRITDPNFFINKNTNADRRHLLTALNLDRIIDPNGQKMTNINTAGVNEIYNNLLNRTGFTSTGLCAQLAVNIIDYRDSDSSVTCFDPAGGTNYYYGFEQPCIYISELVYYKNGSNVSYAIELYRPYPDAAVNPVDVWELKSDMGWTYTLNFTAISWLAGKHFYVIRWGNNPPLSVDPADSVTRDEPAGSVVFSPGGTIWLSRTINSSPIVVDSKILDVWSPAGDGIYSIQRDITPAKCIRWSGMAGIRGLWSGMISGSQTLGALNSYKITESPEIFIQAHPKNGPFINIGELGMIFRKPAYYPAGGSPTGRIGYDNTADEESKVFVNLADPNFQKIFKYLTVIDPCNFYPNDPNYAGETRVKGRININTAPAYVIAQLPWVSLRSGTYNDPNLAKAIVAYRDKTKIHCGEPNDYGTRPDPCGFRSIGELCNVNLGSDPNFGINYYSRDYAVDGITPIDQAGFPDLTTPTPATGDGAANDFEERDLIFARISNLVTVRSDVFTAYILVRIGTDGPQKRCIAILDRSGVKDVNDRVYIRAFQTTPEAR